MKRALLLILVFLPMLSLAVHAITYIIDGIYYSLTYSTKIAIYAGNIVALNIDISTYTEGHYTVTVENSNESFTGVFGIQTTGIEAIRNKKEQTKGYIYKLQGQ